MVPGGTVVIPWTHYGPQYPLWSLGPIAVTLWSQRPIKARGTHRDLSVVLGSIVVHGPIAVPQTHRNPAAVSRTNCSPIVVPEIHCVLWDPLWFLCATWDPLLSSGSICKHSEINWRRRYEARRRSPLGWGLGAAQGPQKPTVLRCYEKHSEPLRD